MATKTQLVEAIDKTILYLASRIETDFSLNPEQAASAVSQLVYARQELLRTYSTPLDIGLLKDSE
jgi:hypothetical protein